MASQFDYLTKPEIFDSSFMARLQSARKITFQPIIYFSIWKKKVTSPSLEAWDAAFVCFQTPSSDTFLSHPCMSQLNFALHFVNLRVPIQCSVCGCHQRVQSLEILVSFYLTWRTPSWLCPYMWHAALLGAGSIEKSPFWGHFLTIKKY